jgi:ankyrin repeat protein
LIPSTPYLLAARFLEPEILAALRRGGADAAATMRDRTTALMLAVGMGASATLDRHGIALIDGGVAPTEALVLRTVEELLDAGVDVNAANDAGDTALHAAAAGGLNGVVSRLARAGARVNARNARGQTPLSQMTARRGQERAGTIELLRALGGVE